MIMDKQMIENILKEEQYPDYMLEKTIEKVERFAPTVMEVFEEWSKSKKEPAISIEGFSFHQLIVEYRMKPIGAFITLDWLLRDPQKAVAALKRGIR